MIKTNKRIWRHTIMREISDQELRGERTDWDVVYVLPLRGGYYYIGRTQRHPDVRLGEHMQESEGNDWVRRHQPLGHYEKLFWYEFGAEATVTLMYMQRHGVDRVRGGQWSRLQLKEHEILEIGRHLRVESQACYMCGLVGHVSRACPRRALAGERGRLRCDTHVLRDQRTFSRCVRTRRENASAVSCIDDQSEDGSDDSESCDSGSDDSGSCDSGSDDSGSCDSGSDDSESCDSGSDDSGSCDSGSDDSGSEQEETCRRCGRCSHTTVHCYARRTIDGQTIV
jgi:predicted GIY-YIG superfamily endonuclease